MNEELYKEAFLNPRLVQGFKNTFLSSRPVARDLADDIVHVTTNPHHAQPGFAHHFSPEEIAAEIKRKDIQQGNGIVLDSLLGATKFVGDRVTRAVKNDPNVRWSGSEAIDNGSAYVRQKSRELSTKGGEKVLNAIGGNKPGSLRGRIFSTQVDTKVGERVLPDKSVIPIMERQRRASIGAPIENTLKIGTPFLASAYLAEKLLPLDEKPKTATVREMAEAIPEPNLLQKREASLHLLELEKQAMFDKTSMLENQLMEKQATIAFLQRERESFEKLAMESTLRADAFEKKVATLQNEVLEKEAAHEELLLQMKALERSGPVDKIATALLEKGLIKQAEYLDKKKELMNCSDEIFNIYEKMASSGKYGEESLESLAFMQDTYSSSNERSSSRVAKGLSKSGQTIGEAAHELSSK